TGRGLRITPDTADKTYGVPSPDGRLVALMKPSSNVLSIVDSPGGRPLLTLTPSDDAGRIQRLRFSADSTMLVVAYSPLENQKPSPGMSFTRGSQVKIWDVKTGRELRSLAPGDV